MNLSAGKFFFLIPYLLLLAVGLTIPSDGNHADLNLKAISFVAAATCFIAYLGVFEITPQTSCLIYYSCQMVVILLIGCLFSLFNAWDFSSFLDQSKIIFITFFVWFLTLFYTLENVLTFKLFFRTIIFANFAYCLFKAFIIALLILKIISLNQLEHSFNFRVMSMTLAGAVTRLQTSVDIVTPFLLFFVLISDKLNISFSTTFKSIYLIFAIIALGFSFSRYLSLVALVAISLFFIMANLRQKVITLGISALIVTALFMSIKTDTLIDLVSLRFFSQEAISSDTTRSDQVLALSKEFLKRPLFGKGIGSYSLEVVRDLKNPHSYEVQWLALVMQMGLIGICLFALPMLMIYKYIFMMPKLFLKISVATMFSLWLLAGLFNPFLLSIASGIVYALFSVVTLLSLKSQVKDAIPIRH